jgi:hypothetical protein
VADGFQEMKKETKVFPYSIRARLGINGFWVLFPKENDLVCRDETRRLEENERLNHFTEWTEKKRCIPADCRRE